MQLKPLQTQSAAKSKLLPRLLLKLPVVCRPRLTKRKLSRPEKQKAAPSQDRAAFLCHFPFANTIRHPELVCALHAFGSRVLIHSTAQ
jgi:hypothetical protein